MYFMGFPDGSVVKESACNAELQETWVRSLGWEGSLEWEMATIPVFLTGESQENPRISEEPGGLQSTRSQRIGYN